MPTTTAGPSTATATTAPTPSTTTTSAGHRRLLLAVAANAVVAYLLTYALVDRVEHLHLTVRNVWPSLMLAAGTGLVTLLAMRERGGPWRRDVAVGVALLATLVGALVMGRAHTGIHNAEFLRAMIPLQSEAIHLCETARISAPDLLDFCDEVVEQREAEIWHLSRLLRRY